MAYSNTCADFFIKKSFQKNWEALMVGKEEKEKMTTAHRMGGNQ